MEGLPLSTLAKSPLWHNHHLDPMALGPGKVVGYGSTVGTPSSMLRFLQPTAPGVCADGPGMMCNLVGVLDQMGPVVERLDRTGPMVAADGIQPQEVALLPSAHPSHTGGGLPSTGTLQVPGSPNRGNLGWASFPLGGGGC